MEAIIKAYNVKAYSNGILLSRQLKMQSQITAYFKLFSLKSSPLS